MSISQKKFVDITSGVGAAAVAANRELIGRFFTNNSLLPTGTYKEFDSAEQVGSYFGTTSEEYLRAVFYFAWIGKNITKAQKISFARWNATASAPQVFGVKGGQSVVSWTSISDGSFKLTINGVQEVMSAIDFTGAANLAAVAALIQTAVRAADVGAMWASATVTYDAVRGSFNFTGGVTGPATITVQAGTGGTDIAAQLGWIDPVNTILSDGAAVQTPTEVLTQSADSSDNFGSFTFIPALTQDQIVEAATWNNARNVQFMYSVRVAPADASALAAALEDIGGVSITLAPLATEYPEQVPMMILAATDYTALNATVNFMYQLFNLTPSVLDDTAYDLYTGLRINFYGQTQRAGRQIQFYMEGVMQGLPVDIVDQNTYSNEIWLKDAAEAAILTLLLALPKVSANSKGRAQLLTIMQGVVNQAILNGTISVGKPFTDVQKLYIAEQTGDAKAWYQVQNQGYWLDVRIVPYTDGDVTKYKAVYTLIYSKDDIIRKVEGRDILI